MIGIALAGWDRLGWRGGLAERWMRLHDRRSLLAAVILLVGYGALTAQAIVFGLSFLTGLRPSLMDDALRLLLIADLFLLCWRLALRAGFVTRNYGWREGMRSIPRAVLSNIIAMMAARRAVSGYLRMRRSGRTVWDKTDHIFPATAPAE